MAYDPVEGFQVSSQAVSGRAARAGGRSHNALLWQPPTLARYRFGDRGLQMITHCVPTAPGYAVFPFFIHNTGFPCVGVRMTIARGSRPSRRATA